MNERVVGGVMASDGLDRTGQGGQDLGSEEWAARGAEQQQPCGTAAISLDVENGCNQTDLSSLGFPMCT